LGETAVEDVLRALGHLDRIAPELGDLLDEAKPIWSAVEPSVAVELLQNRFVNRPAFCRDSGVWVLTGSVGTF